MGLYRAVAGPLFFSLAPQAARRFAQSILSLPLAWERMGERPEDPGLRTSLAGIELSTPVGLAAGFDKSCRHLHALGRLGFGYVVGGTITRDPRPGNAKPRIARYARRGSMTNAMGLPNPGAEAAARILARSPRSGPRFASIADEGPDEVIASHGLLEPHVDGFELNASCPNVSWGRDRDNEGHLALLMRELGARRTRPLFVKLPPFRSDVEREAVLALARIAQDGGADGLTCSNTRPVSDRHLSVGAGGLSGRELFPDTVRIVGEVVAVDGVDLDVTEGEFFSILGPSGSGKTTCLRMIAGFEAPTDGRVWLGGQDVSGLPPYERDVNTVFQDYALFPHMTVGENVEYGLRVKKVAREERTKRMADALRLVRLDGCDRRKPVPLSGGQRQRVAAARALVSRPRVRVRA